MARMSGDQVGRDLSHKMFSFGSIYFIAIPIVVPEGLISYCMGLGPSTLISGHG